TPESVASLPDPVHDLVVNAYADALAPSFWYMVPVFLVAFVLAWFLPQLTLSDVAGMVARGEAVYGEDMGGAARGVADSGQADAAGAAAEGHARLATIAVEEETGPAPGSETGTIRVGTEPGADPAKDHCRPKQRPPPAPQAPSTRRRPEARARRCVGALRTPRPDSAPPGP